MKILLDECVTKRLKRYLPNHETFTVTEMGWSGLKNGKLMSKAVENSFDILLTIDKNLSFQQNLKNYLLSVVILNTATSKLEDILLLLPQFFERIEEYKKGKAYLIENLDDNDFNI